MFVVCYVLITTDRFNKTKVALAGAILMFFLPLISSEDVFYSRDTGVNWDVLFLLLGMMIIVSVVRQTGAFEYVAIWSAKRAKGSPLRIMILLILVTALGNGSSRQRHHGVVDRAGHAAGVRPPCGQPRAVSRD